ncbi:translation initiation factor eIF-2B subunit delta [Prunus yedoensis var. nudiflora]|uniref:Translation initiation factor eIF2B subunit delta n=1 Tax=Prunus yedoensis var. nudiflora TaxID=2094558 RepID=A0A314XF32_PRUYE|nr:translation initiation factor eIF-2B subunit delta [Prunus yedoensis var. nudiflora]
MIPPSRHLSDTVVIRTAALPVPESASRRKEAGERVPVGSYNPSESLLGTSPSSRVGDGTLEFSDESSVRWYRRSDSGKLASSFPGEGFDSATVKAPLEVPEKSGEEVSKEQKEVPSNSEPLKSKTTTKAERRALQEAQRAAKAAAKAEGKKPAAVSRGGAPVKPAKQSVQKKDPPPVASSVAASDKKGGDRPPEKERKKDVPPPRMQFDDKNRVDKAKRRAVVNQTEAKNRVELFRHLPQYEQELSFLILSQSFSNLILCILPFIRLDCSIWLEKYPGPLSISMGNAIRFLKSRIAKLPLTLSESEAKSTLCSEIDRFINEKIILADKVRDGDVLLTYGSSCVVEMILLYAHELGKQFRVVVVDSRPKLEGQALLRRLVAKGLSCTYTHINAVSYIMHEVTRVFLGAASVLSNGTVYSRVGTACVAMVAHAFCVPVLICCEAYKFHERVQLDSICSNELGDPDAIAKVSGRTDVNYLDNWANKENLQLLNLMYDATPSDYISMIVTDYGMIPPTSVPVIVREYGREHLWT